MTQITYKPLHPTFIAEVIGADFNNVTPELVDELKQGLAKYGVLVCRGTGLDSTRHVEMSRLFGELDDVTPYSKLGWVNRLAYDELFDVSNVNADGSIMQPNSERVIFGKGNGLFHVDSGESTLHPMVLSSQAKHSILAEQATYGDVDLRDPVDRTRALFSRTSCLRGYVDTRTAYDDLDDATKQRIADYVIWHSQHHSRRKANPGEPILIQEKYLPETHPFGKHRLVQTHEPSGRTNLYIANHAYKVEDQDLAEGQKEIQALLEHCSQRKYICSVEWIQPGDLVIWDNTCVMHRSTSGSYEGKYKRDMRRTTVHDASSQAWGLNKVGDPWRSGLP